MSDDEKPVVIVTGAGSGIGRATAELFARKDVRVVASDIDGASAESTAKAIRSEAGGQCTARQCDVTSATDVEELVKYAKDTYGRLDYAVNNAGREDLFVDTAEYPVDHWPSIIAVDLTSVFYCMRYELPIMIEQGFGSIVNTASILGLAAYPGTSAYTAAKHGVIGLTKTVALEVAEKGVRVNAVCPGFTNTSMVTERVVSAKPGSEKWNAIAALHAMNRLGEPQEIAEAIYWLSCSSSSFVTGQALAADGGYLAR
jgi:NAD(P)-dependent dehydrogenase (short-subunit alcohol dehydrogenase family)